MAQYQINVRQIGTRFYLLYKLTCLVFTDTSPQPPKQGYKPEGLYHEPFQFSGQLLGLVQALLYTARGLDQEGSLTVIGHVSVFSVMKSV